VSDEPGKDQGRNKRAYAPQRKPGEPHRFAKGNPGRPMGVPNKSTIIVRDAIAEALSQAGGAAFFLRMAMSEDVRERCTFAQVAARLVPQEIKAEVGNVFLQLVPRPEISREEWLRLHRNEAEARALEHPVIEHELVEAK